MSKQSRSKRRAEYRAEKQARDGERKLDTMQVAALDAVAEAVDIVERKVGVDESRQPRFTSPQSIFSSVLHWALTAMANEPSTRATPRTWDTWYRAFALREPFLSGVLNSAVQIDQNRGWTLTGGRNQVNKFTRIFHDLDDGAGWRGFIAWQAQAYYCTQMGFVSEVGRNGRGGPLANLWSVDPCRCELSGNPALPLRYYPKQGGMQEWKPDFFMRGKSLVRTSEDNIGYGFPAVARCYELSKIMVGVFSHYQQKVGTRTPDGILTGKFISEDQWDEAIRARTESLNASSDNYLNALATIMSSGGDMPEFALTLMSSIPDRWDIEVWTSILMRGYALAFGYQSSEFYPENAGVMGRGKEQEIQHESATGKGGKDFSLTIQEQLQNELPPTLQFEFDERDTTGEAEDAALKLSKAQVISTLSGLTEKSGGVEQSRLTTDQIMQLAAEEGLVPEDWTPTTEDVTATDEEDADEESAPVELSERVMRAMRAFPDEPIVRYSWPSGKTRIIRPVRRTMFHIPKVLKRSVSEVVTLYNDQLTNFVFEVLNGTSDATDLSRAHRALLRQLGPQAYMEGLREGGISPEDADVEDKRAVDAWLKEQLGFIGKFASDVVAARGDDGKRAQIMTRLSYWVESMRTVGAQGLMSARSNAMGTWKLGATEKHCRTCANLHGKRHRLSWYKSRGLIPRQPGSTSLECRGYQCDCHIQDDKGNTLI